MVQLLADPTVSHVFHSTTASTTRDVVSKTHHDHLAQELNVKRGFVRTPKRGWSMTDYQGDLKALSMVSLPAPRVERKHVAPMEATSSVHPGHGIIPNRVPHDQHNSGRPQRPKPPPPRRSYSVMDYEPLPTGQPRPSANLTLLDLPSELHYSLFDFLDPIDGVCLGLAHSRLYAIHRRKYGTVPLHSRYAGPNDMEWAWRGAGPLVRRSPSPPLPATAAAAAVTAETEARRREQLRVQGQVYCRKCGISRCELHRHLRDWMGKSYEYCEVRKMYGPRAGHDAKPHCFMSSPSNRHRCGRHGGGKKLALEEARQSSS